MLEQFLVDQIQKIYIKMKEVLPGLEPGSKDSESLVMTNYTTRPRLSPFDCCISNTKHFHRWADQKVARRLRDSNSRGRVPN